MTGVFATPYSGHCLNVGTRENLQRSMRIGRIAKTLTAINWFRTVGLLAEKPHPLGLVPDRERLAEVALPVAMAFEEKWSGAERSLPIFRIPRPCML